MKIKGSNVLITGGASGIGKIMGRMALEKGARNLIIWDINIAAIEAVKQDFKELFFGRITFLPEVSEKYQLKAYYSERKDEDGYDRFIFMFR